MKKEERVNLHVSKPLPGGKKEEFKVTTTLKEEQSVKNMYQRMGYTVRRSY